MKYAALHCHCTYSFLDGVGTVEHWVRGAQEKGLSALALTDHGDSSNVFELIHWGNKLGFPVIAGCELYITDTLEKDHTNRYQHQIVWAKDRTGYYNLCKLHKLAWSNDGHFYYRPRITYQDLADHKDGLMVSGACIAGPIASLILDWYEHMLNTGELSKELEQKYINRLEWFMETFKDDFYLEMQYCNQCHDWDHKQHCFQPLPNGLDRQAVVNRVYLHLAQKYPKLKLVASPDAHMVHNHEKDVQDCVMGTRYMKKAGDNADREVLGWHFHETYYLPTYDEMVKHYTKNFSTFITEDHAHLFLKNTLEVADKSYLTLDRQVYLPNVKIEGVLEDRNSGTNKLLREVKRHGVILDKLRTDERYKTRLISEISTLVDNGTIDLSGYFLLLADVVEWAKKNDVMVGPGRGSAGGCLLAYALGITMIDPIEWNLPFERFINLTRIRMGTLPDIDIDFAKPNLIFEYLQERWGRDFVCGISANQTFKFKLALRDAYRGLTTNTVGSELEGICKLVGDDESDEKIAEWMETEQVKAWVRNGERHESSPTTPEDRLKVITVAKALLGQQRHRGVHAAAVVVASKPIHEIIPVARANPGKYEDKWVTQPTMHWVEEAGLVKFDILGLNTLNDIGTCVKLIKQYRGEDINVYDLNWKDPQVLANFTPNNVTSVFQFDTEVARPYLAKVRPQSIADLAMITSVARPGAMDSNQDTIFIERWQGKAPVEYPHSALESVLADTYGVMLYQEQVMAAVQILGGFTAEEADDIRRGMGKKKIELLQAAQERFEAYATNNFPDIDKKKAEKIWLDIFAFARYGFNKSHATTYAMLAYICQYLKTHFPKEWWCSVLQNEDDETRFRRIFGHIQGSSDIAVSMPDINSSGDSYCINDKGHIVVPLTCIKKIGIKVLLEIMKKRTTPYQSLADFCERVEGRVVNKSMVQQLIVAGCFDNLHSDLSKKQILASYFDWRIAQKGVTAKEKEKFRTEYDTNYANMNRINELALTAEALPIFVQDYHLILRDLSRYDLMPFGEVSELSADSNVVTAGLIKEVTYRKTKKGQDFAFLELSNAGTILRLTLWPEQFQRYYEMAQPNTFVEVIGKIDQWNGRSSVVVKTLKSLGGLAA